VKKRKRRLQVEGKGEKERTPCNTVSRTKDRGKKGLGLFVTGESMRMRTKKEHVGEGGGEIYALPEKRTGRSNLLTHIEKMEEQ